MLVLAEAGISECARAGSCSLGWDFGLFVFVLGMFPIWGSALGIAIWASITIRRRRLSREASAVWLSAVWLLPWLGGLAWGGYRTSTTAAEHYLDRPDGDPDPPFPLSLKFASYAERRE